MANWCIAKPPSTKKRSIASRIMIDHYLYNPNAPKGGIPYAILTEAEVYEAA